VPARNSGIKYCADNGLLDMNDPNMVFFKSYFDRAAVSGLVLGPELSKKVAQLRQEAIFPNYEAALLGSKSAEQAFRDIVSTADRILKQP
jgi:hypothetical protein